MAVMYILFGIVFVLSLFILGILLFVIKVKPVSARYIEMIGYGFLVISLIWTGVTNITNDSSRGNDYLLLDEKLKVLWTFEGDKIDYILNKDIDNLYQDYYLFSNHLQGPISDIELFETQVELANNISYGLFVLSTLFIAAGRLEELIKRISEKKNTKST